MEQLSPHDPRTVGDFRLHSRLGSGGMGRVYLGYSRAGRAVAVKVVRPELAGDPEFTRRFTREVEAAKTVSGMYTAPVVATGLDDDPPWLATVFVPGPSLAEFVERHGPLPEHAVWRLAAGLTEALQAVHAAGLVHRDIKPANVLVAPDGPHLIDFGISRAFDGTTLTQAGMVIGTPGYMSPEQAEGTKVGPPSDVFSLGALLAFAATGKPPFGRGNSAAVLFRLVSANPDLEGVPAGLREFLTACLAKDPGRRPDLRGLSAMITKHGPSLSFTSATSATDAFWPAEMAGLLRASQPAPWKAESRALAAAGAASGARRGGAARAGGAQPGAAGSRAVGGTLPMGGNAPQAYGPPMAGYGVPWQYAPYGTRRPYYPYGHYEPPRTPMAGAARLMRLGAAVSLVNAIVTLSSIAQIRASALARHPLVPAGAARAVASGAAGAAVVGAVVSVALWLWLAGAATRGRRWVRPVGTALFVIDTMGVLGALKNPGIAAAKDLNVVAWLIALLAVIAMWARRAPR